MLTAISHELQINIGGMPILIRTESPEFVALLQERYGSFAEPKGPGFGFRCSGSVKQVSLPDCRLPTPIFSGLRARNRADSLRRHHRGA